MRGAEHRQRVARLEESLRERAFQNGLLAFNNTPGARRKEHVFHYTNVEAGCSIIQEGRLRLAPDDERSDPLELRFGSQVLENVHRNLGHGSLFSVDQVNPYAPNATGKATWGAYIASLSAAFDVPHHWQNFANGGRGVAIMISAAPGTHEVPIASGERHYRLHFGPVTYDHAKQEKVLTDLWKHATDEATDPDLGERGARQALRQVLGEVLPFLKHESYGGESEWRLSGARLSGHVSEAATVAANNGTVSECLEAILGGADTPLALTGIVTGPRLSEAEHARLVKIWGHGIGLSVEPTRSKWTF